ncbi:MAG: hypothetical protein M3N57_07425 [Actinomycetota bacterium]|nr:hypothetical protein [Actinomycetota bacterium]
MLAKQLSKEFMNLLRERASDFMRDAEALSGAMEGLSISTHRWEPLASCPDAGVDVDWEVVDSTFVLWMENEELRFALHRPDGEDGADLEVRVIQPCLTCGEPVPFDPPVEDRETAGRALVAGRPWRHHHCAPAAMAPRPSTPGWRRHTPAGTPPG